MAEVNNMKVTLRKNALTREYKQWFEKKNPGFTATGDVLGLYFENGEGIEYAVMKGAYTPPYSCRKCENCYIVATYYSYYKINKDTFEIEIVNVDEY